jgi:hypothetical protein
MCSGQLTQVMIVWLGQHLTRNFTRLRSPSSNDWTQNFSCQCAVQGCKKLLKLSVYSSDSCYCTPCGSNAPVSGTFSIPWCISGGTGKGCGRLDNVLHQLCVCVCGISVYMATIHFILGIKQTLQNVYEKIMYTIMPSNRHSCINFYKTAIRKVFVTVARIWVSKMCLFIISQDSADMEHNRRVQVVLWGGAMFSKP